MWYAGDNDTLYRLGPFQTRAEALQEGYDEGFDIIHICEAEPHDFKLSDFINVEYMNEVAADSYQMSEGDDDPVFDLTENQIQSLRSVIDKWQEVNDLKFTCRTFEWSDNHEIIEAVHL